METEETKKPGAPDIWLAVFEEDGWCEDLKKKAGGKIYSVYWYDATKAVHLCSFTPSYELYLLEYVADEYPEDDDAREELYDDLTHAVSEGERVIYWNCSDVERLPVDGKEDGDEKAENHQPRRVQGRYRFEKVDKKTWDELFEDGGRSHDPTGHMSGYDIAYHILVEYMHENHNTGVINVL